MSVKSGAHRRFAYICRRLGTPDKEKRRLSPASLLLTTHLYGQRGLAGAVVPAGAGLVPKSTVGAVSDPGAAS